MDSEDLRECTIHYNKKSRTCMDGFHDFLNLFCVGDTNFDAEVIPEVCPDDTDELPPVTTAPTEYLAPEEVYNEVRNDHGCTLQ